MQDVIIPFMNIRKKNNTHYPEQHLDKALVVTKF